MKLRRKSIVANASVMAVLLGSAACVCALKVWGQQSDTPVYRADVKLVVLTFSVTDANGKSVNGLRPSDIRIFEDGIPQKIASFAQGSKPAVRLLANGPASTGTNNFVLFDTSDRMYQTLPYVRDSIADFIRRLGPGDSVAVYTFSRNLLRASPLTSDLILASTRFSENVSAGDDTALFNCLLLTVRDASKLSGRTVIVVFSNGPDTASVVSPEDVGRVAQDEGIPVYIVSTLDENKDQPFARTLDRLTSRTGGRLYLARKWQEQSRAFASIQDDIGSSYTISYYPAPNPNEGFRSIKVEVDSGSNKTYRIRARDGYQPRREVTQTR
jgi:Ca-activated chloride channel homolog